MYGEQECSTKNIIIRQGRDKQQTEDHQEHLDKQEELDFTQNP